MDILGLFTTNYTVTITLLLPALIIFYWYLTINDDYWKKRGIPHEPRPSFLKMCYVVLRKNLYEAELEKYRRHGRVHGDFEGRVPVLIIAEPDLIRDVLVKDFQYFTSSRELDMSIDPTMTNMIFALNGEAWKRVRTIVTPAFSSGKMRKMASTINECSKTVTEAFIRSSKERNLVDCKKVFAAYTMDVIVSCAFGTKLNSHKDPSNPFLVQAHNALYSNGVLKMIAFVLLPVSLWKYTGLKLLDPAAVEFFRSVTLQIVEERTKKGKKGNDFLQLMMDACKEQLATDKKVDGFKTLEHDDDEKDTYGDQEINKTVFKATYSNKSLSQDELFAQCMLFFLVGYETSSAVLSFAAYSLATHPEVQEKLIQEIDQATKGNDELTHDIIRDMKYLDCVVSETLRMYPAVLRADRTAVKDYKLNYKGLTIPKGMVIGVPIQPIHYDPEFFAEPEKFIPERFLPENIRHPPYAYLPFGAGPRNCLGNRFALMQIKLCIGHALRRVRFKTCPETKIPPEVSMSPQGFLSPKGLVLTCEERKDIF